MNDRLQYLTKKNKATRQGTEDFWEYLSLKMFNCLMNVYPREITVEDLKGEMRINYKYLIKLLERNRHLIELYSKVKKKEKEGKRYICKGNKMWT